MKLEIFLFRAAVLGIFTALAGVTFNALPAALFAGASALWVLLIATTDYSRRREYTAALTNIKAGRAALPLAA
jgi:hypothetical protein